MVHLHLPQSLEAISHCYYKGVSYLNMLTVNIKSPLLPILHHSCLNCWSISLAFMEESHITGRNLLFASMLFRLSASDAVWISEAGLQSLTVCVCKHNLPEMQCNRLQITGVTHSLFVCLNPQHLPRQGVEIRLTKFSMDDNATRCLHKSNKC